MREYAYTQFVRHRIAIVRKASSNDGSHSIK